MDIKFAKTPLAIACSCQFLPALGSCLLSVFAGSLTSSSPPPDQAFSKPRLTQTFVQRPATHRPVPCIRFQLDVPMRRRSSASTEEDDPSDDNLPPSDPIDDAAQATLNLPQSPALESDNSAKRRSFTSSKSHVARQSDTLDRRKVEKSLISATTPPQNDWAPTQPASQRNSIEKDKQSQQNQQLDPSQPSAAGTVDGMDSKEWRRSRPRSPWRCSLLTLITTLSSILVLAVIVNSFFNKQLDPKGCKMCYMSPGFAKLHGFDTEHTRFASKYSVYLYREAGLDEDTMVCGSILQLCLRLKSY